MPGRPRHLFADLVDSSAGRAVVKALGVPTPVTLRRYHPGQPLVDGPVLIAGLAAAPLAARAELLLEDAGLRTITSAAEAGQELLGAIVIDLTEVSGPDDLNLVRLVLGPALKRLAPSGRVIVGGRCPQDAAEPGQAAARQGIVGLIRSVGKELRRGATVNLVQVRAGVEVSTGHADAALAFLLSARSAYVDAQIITIELPELTASVSTAKPLAGKVAVVTGAARGIGAAAAHVLARDGAAVVCVDVSAAGADLARVANRVAGTALQVDVTAPDAGRRIAEHARARHGGLDIVVHNAGITRDKLLVNMDSDRWQAVMAVNLQAILSMNEVFLGEGGISDGGRLVLLASVAGIAGNRGQTNYAASKAGIIGLVRAYATDPRLRGRGITANAVAPGFIESEMTAKMPLVTRELGRRLNSMNQGGQPVDVAETIGWLAEDAAVNGNIIRVCGQSLLGA
ncbi:MAG: 3-oxoacyl-ACP reductase [Nostocoides sp.]